MHTQPIRHFTHRVPLTQPSLLAKDRDAALLDYLGDLSEVQAAVIGPGALEFTCLLLRRGCIAATALCRNQPGETATADMVVIPDAVSAEAIGQSIAQAWKTLAPNGWIVLRIQDDPSGTLAVRAIRQLRVTGFSSIAVEALPEQTLLTAERPFFGPTLHS